MSEYEFLRPAITQALTAPGVDLTAISARAVRKTLVATDSTLSTDWVKANKDGIDKLIAEVFSSIAVNVTPSEPPIKRKREQDDEGNVGTPHRDTSVSHANPSTSSLPSTPFPPSQQPISHHVSLKDYEETPDSVKQEKADAAYARQLASQLNATGGRTTRGGSSNGPSVGSSSHSKKRSAGSSGGGGAKKKSKVKSPSKIADSDDDGGFGSGSDGEGDDDDEAPKKKSRTKAKPKRGDGDESAPKGGFQKEFGLSNALSAVCDDAQQMSRPQVVSNLWKYIKANNLQNPRNKREIMCDEKLRDVFRTTKVNMFTMNKLLGEHLYEIS